MNKKPRWIRVTEATNIPLREGRAIEVDGREIALFNLGDRFLAVENRCPHRGGPLADGIVSGNVVVCPLHAWKVCLEDGSVVRPAEERACVKSYRTCVTDGVVSVEIAAQPRFEAGEKIPALVSSGESGEPAAQGDLDSGSFAG